MRARVLAVLVAAMWLATTGLSSATSLTGADGSAGAALRSGPSDRAPIPTTSAPTPTTRAPTPGESQAVRDAASTLVVAGVHDPTSLRRHPLVDRLEHDPILDRWVVTTSAPTAVARDLRTQRLDPEPVHVVTAGSDGLAAAPTPPSDPSYPDHWGAALSGLPYAFAVTTWPLDPPIIAILDTGVAPHPELGDRLLPGADLLPKDGDPPGDGDGRSDPHGHGTATALTAAAAADDGRGSVGSCPRCRILPIRVLDETGVGLSTTVAQGIRTAVDLGADVINISAGGSRIGGSHSYEDSAVAYATAAGVPILASAGNAGSTEPEYPAALPGVIAVGGYVASGARATDSNHGEWVDVAAPWCSVVGAPDGAPDDARSFCGTSSSAPFASGMVGLRRATVGAEPVVDVRSRLRAATRPVSWVASGRLDACSVVRGEPAIATPAAALEWPSGAAPAALPFDLPHPCGADHVRVEVAGQVATRTMTRGAGRLSFTSTASFDLAAIPAGGHDVLVTVTDPLGRRTVTTHQLVVTSAGGGHDPDQRFTDVAVGSTHEAAIYWLADRGITRGCSQEGDRYCPAASVTRAQMASFLRAALALPPGPTDRFVDVAPASTHAAAIGAMLVAKITTGCDGEGPRYCPSTSVSRAQMAAFLTRGLDLPVPADLQRFDDVPAGSRHAGSIAALAGAGITGGCSKDGTLFCPAAPVTRAQMATFLRNALDR